MTQLETSSRTLAFPLADDLSRFGDQVAVIDRDLSAVTYRELADRVEAVSQQLGSTRRLVAIEARNDLESLVAYLAALSGGHVALLLDAGSQARQAIVDCYEPDVVISGTQLREVRDGTVHDLHPDLALLLSTSGSTGSPKLVRLSHENVQANAESIATYLGITGKDCAALTLPMHYCYGLSIINSNLLRGATLMLTDYSVVDECFWRDFAAVGATSLHGVPFTFEMMDRIGFDEKHLPSLRYVTQAGGRLSPEDVKRYAELGMRHGWDFFVMYGQTEATARMAYLPSELALTNPTAIGRAIPGGAFSLRDGELVYSGPNVMLGYAESAQDLVRGRDIEELETGDLARVNEHGLFEIVGRKNRFLKIAGLRIDLGRVEKALQLEGIDAVCSGDDSRLVVAVRGDIATLRSVLDREVGLGVSAIVVAEVDEFPRLANGKVDYTAIKDLANETDGEPNVLVAAYRSILRRRVEPTDSFLSVGGDSLSYVAISTAIERHLGHLPDNWQKLSIEELQGLQPRKSRMASMETGVVVRAVAICCVVANHVGLFSLMGGAHVLLMLAGWNFARFTLNESNTSVSRRMLKSVALIAIPSMIWITYRNFVEYDVGLMNILLVNNYFGDNSWGYWYVDALVQVLLVLSLFFAIPAVRRAERKHGFGFAVGVLAVCVALRQIDWTPAGVWEPFMVTHIVVWLFALGWALFRATTTPQRLLVAIFALLLIPGFFNDVQRDLAVLTGFALVAFVPRILVPRGTSRLIAALASASLYIYLTHYGTWPLLLDYVPALPATLGSIAIGVVSWWASERLIARGSFAWRSRQRQRLTSGLST